MVEVGACQEEEGCEAVEAVPVPGCQDRPAVADAVCVVAPDQVGGDVLVKVDETVEKLKTKNLSLHGHFVANSAAQACALMRNNRFRRDKKETVEENEDSVWLLAVDKTKRENSTGIEQLEKDVMTVILKVDEVIGGHTRSLKQAMKEVSELINEREAVTRELSKLCGGIERVEYEQEAKL